MTEPILSVQGVAKTIRGKLIVHPLDFTLQAGQVLALIGGNGAGKSTILRMIAGITQPTAGTIRVAGLEWKRARAAYAGKIGYMPDDFQFGHGLTARETILFYASLRNVSVTKTEEIMELVGLSAVQKQSTASFSKGMRQRLLFAQALLADPPLLVLDEPTNGLDPNWMQSFIQLVNRLKQTGQSMIFSTHHLQVAEETADQAMFLHAGEVKSSGTLASYRDRYGVHGLTGAFHDLNHQAPLATQTSGQRNHQRNH